MVKFVGPNKIVDKWRTEEFRGLANRPHWKATWFAISSVHMWKKTSFCSCLQLSALLFCVERKTHILQRLHTSSPSLVTLFLRFHLAYLAGASHTGLEFPKTLLQTDKRE